MKSILGSGVNSGTSVEPYNLVAYPFNDKNVFLGSNFLQAHNNRTQKDPEGARVMYEQSLAESKNSKHQESPAALVGLAVYHLDYTHDINQAIELLERAADLGNPDARHNLALLNLEGKMKKLPPNHIYAFNQFLQAAQNGHVESVMKLVNYYYEGIIENNHHLLPVVRKDAVSWSRFVVYTVDPELSQLLKLAVQSKLEGKLVQSMMLYSIGSMLGIEIAAYNAAWIADHIVSLDATGNHDDLILKLWEDNTNVGLGNPHRLSLTMLGEQMLNRNRIKRAEDLFVKAARSNCPRSLFNLGLLDSISPENMRKLNLKENHRVECLVRCTKVAKLTDSLPCYFLLWKLQLDAFINRLLKKILYTNM